MTILKPILTFAHTLLESALKPGDIAIDCTMGNGNDTVFLAKLTGESGHVFAFDIQESAVENTRKRLEQDGISPDQVSLIRDSHANLVDYVPAAAFTRVRAAIFNLGYLPGGDKHIYTMPHTTIAGIEALLSILASGGVVVLVVYPGHDAGQKEASDVLDYCENLPRETVNVIAYRILNNPNQPPFVIALEKK